MRPILSSFGLVILLAACQIALPGASGKSRPAEGGIAAEVIEVTSLDAPPASAPPPATTDLTAATVAPEAAPGKDSAEGRSAAPAQDAAADVPPGPDTVPAQATTEPERPKTNAGEPRPEEQPPLLKTQAWIACEKRGGVWERAAAGSASFCQMPTRDGGKQCRRSTDCEGYCLARSGTCAPVTPLLGCQDILNENGRMLTQCIN